MPELFGRCWKVLCVIVRSKYSFSKLRLWITWLRLIAKSIKDHKLSGTTSSVKIEHILDRSVYFVNYGALIDLFEEIFLLQSYRTDLDQTSPFIIDAGSNIGMSMLYFKIIHPHASVVCFEPDSHNFEMLKRNVLENKLANVTTHQLALSDIDGEVKLFSAPSSLNSGLYGSVDSTHEIVASKKLSTFIDREVDLLKIDIEGAEDLVIADLINSGKISLVKNMIIEHHPKISHTTTDEFVAKLQAINFNVTIQKNSFHPGATEVMIIANRYDPSVNSVPSL